jgi:hypothetical protein
MANGDSLSYAAELEFLSKDEVRKGTIYFHLEIPKNSERCSLFFLFRIIILKNTLCLYNHDVNICS